MTNFFSTWISWHAFSALLSLSTPSVSGLLQLLWQEGQFSEFFSWIFADCLGHTWVLSRFLLFNRYSCSFLPLKNFVLLIFHHRKPQFKTLAYIRYTFRFRFWVSPLYRSFSFDFILFSIQSRVELYILIYVFITHFCHSYLHLGLLISIIGFWYGKIISSVSSTMRLLLPVSSKTVSLHHPPS